MEDNSNFLFFKWPEISINITGLPLISGIFVINKKSGPM